MFTGGSCFLFKRLLWCINPSVESRAPSGGLRRFRKKLVIVSHEFHNVRFVGREDLLTKTHSTLARRRHLTVQVLPGVYLTGSGVWVIDESLTTKNNVYHGHCEVFQ